MLPHRTLPHRTLPHRTLPTGHCTTGRCPQDAAPQDTAPQDAAPQDTASQDTAPQDTAPQDAVRWCPAAQNGSSCLNPTMAFQGCMRLILINNQPIDLMLVQQGTVGSWNQLQFDICGIQDSRGSTRSSAFMSSHLSVLCLWLGPPAALAEPG
ncbi:hypothetical protein NFI96_008360 [Prochilodus magdalenae]|nr:hypothetical protein NFI96_008360 [Prochilodus magdalenae]